VDQYAYVAVESDGFFIIDISQPANPTIAAKFPGPYAKDIAVVGNYAYVADQDFGLRVVDVSNPATPVLVGSCSSDGPFGVAVAGDYAYCADNDSGFCIINISNPTAPVIVSRYLALESTRHVEVQGNNAFLADDGTGPVILDISNPSAPSLVSHFQSACKHLTLYDDYVYVAQGWEKGLAVIDISNLTQPRLAGSCSTPTITEGLDSDDNYIYVAANDQFLIYSK